MVKRAWRIFFGASLASSSRTMGASARRDVAALASRARAKKQASGRRRAGRFINVSFPVGAGEGRRILDGATRRFKRKAQVVTNALIVGAMLSRPSGAMGRSSKTAWPRKHALPWQMGGQGLGCEHPFAAHQTRTRTLR